MASNVALSDTLGSVTIFSGCCHAQCSLAVSSVHATTQDAPKSRPKILTALFVPRRDHDAEHDVLRSRIAQSIVKRAAGKLYTLHLALVCPKSFFTATEIGQRGLNRNELVLWLSQTHAARLWDGNQLHHCCARLLAQHGRIAVPRSTDPLPPDPCAYQGMHHTALSPWPSATYVPPISSGVVPSSPSKMNQI